MVFLNSTTDSLSSIYLYILLKVIFSPVAEAIKPWYCLYTLCAIFSFRPLYWAQLYTIHSVGQLFGAHALRSRVIYPPLKIPLRLLNPHYWFCRQWAGGSLGRYLNLDRYLDRRLATAYHHSGTPICTVIISSNEDGWWFRQCWRFNFSLILLLNTADMI